MKAPPVPAATVDRIRAFNRGWTEVLGLLDSRLLATEHTLAEARVLFELAQRERWERRELRERLGIDASFLTRVVAKLVAKGLVRAKPSRRDGRAVELALTPRGRKAFAVLDARSHGQIHDLVERLSAEQRSQVAEAMALVMALTRPASSARSVTIRGLEPGDMGWVIQRHGAVYADEFGWNADFEGMVARIVADYHANFEPGFENAWIAEVDGARAGCVFCCRRDARTAQLRVLLVERWARGRRIGQRLVDECIAFARAAGYAQIVLWTNDVLVSARRIYEAAGFELVGEEKHHSFGHDHVGQHWALRLR